MDHFVLRSRCYDLLKHEARDAFPNIQSAHLTEAVARGLGFGSHAALLASLRDKTYLQLAKPFSVKLFAQALLGFGREPSPEFEDDDWSWRTVLLWDVLCDLAMGEGPLPDFPDKPLPPLKLPGDFRLDRGLSASMADVAPRLVQAVGFKFPEHLDVTSSEAEWLGEELNCLLRANIVLQAPPNSWGLFKLVSVYFIQGDLLVIKFYEEMFARMHLHQTPRHLI